jgi:hypothetical protein
MRKLLLMGGAAALIAVPSAALAETGETVPETDPAAEEVVGTTTDKALHSEGSGGFRYEGAGGVVIGGEGVVKVRDLSAAKDLVTTPSGFATTTTSKDGLWTRYSGRGSLTLDGSQYLVRVRGTFTADVDPTATHPAIGTAWDWGKGQTTLKGGVPWPFESDQKILLTSAGPLLPMSVDLQGRGAPRWHRDGDDGPKGHRAKRVVVRKVVVTKRFVNGKRVFSRRVVSERGWWRWHRRDPGATWRLNGPASGKVDISDIDGRIRVWDKSAAKDLVVTVPPTGTTTETLSDGSVVYSGLRDAKVALSGTGFRMKAVGWDLEGTFTPTEGSRARSFVRGKGSFDTADFQDVRARKHDGTRVLLQPAVPK